MSRKSLLFLMLVAAASSAFAATSYTDEATFLAAIDATYYLEDFSSYTYGSPLDGTQLTYDFGPVSGYSWQAAASQGLWSNVSSLSTNNAADALGISFTGDPVTACGGIITSTDFNGNPIAQSITATLNDGTVVTFAGGTGFAGFTSDVPLTSLTIDAVDSPSSNWSQLDHFYVGAMAGGMTPTPEQTATPAETPTPAPTDTPEPTATPEETATPEPTQEPTSTPTMAYPFGVRIEMPLVAHPGEDFYVTGLLDNPDATRTDVPTFFILGVYGQYFFWPSWSLYYPPESTAIDYRLETVPTGGTTISVIPTFAWPDTGMDVVDGLYFYGAFLTATFDAIDGEFAMIEWGYGPNP